MFYPQNFAAYVRDPLLLQALTLGGLDQIRDRSGTAVLHHQPELIVLPGRRLLDKGSVVGGDVAVIRVFL